MAELTEDQKREIVDMLACFRDPATILEHFQSVHGLDLTHKQVGGYDPTRSYYVAGEGWREIFAARRKAYLEDVATVPIANQGFRLNILHEHLEKALKNGKGDVLAILEQAAREVGGLMTNQREMRLEDNRRPRPSEMTAEDRRAAMVEIIRQAMEEAQNQPPPDVPALT